MQIRLCFRVALAATAVSLPGCSAFDEEEAPTEVAVDPELAAQVTRTPCARDSVRVPIDAISDEYDRNGNGFVCRDVLGGRVRWHDDRE